MLEVVDGGLTPAIRVVSLGTVLSVVRRGRVGVSSGGGMGRGVVRWIPGLVLWLTRQ